MVVQTDESMSKRHTLREWYEDCTGGGIDIDGGMSFNAYQQAALRTATIDLTDREFLMYLALGLNGEAGEVAEIIKKHIRDGLPLTKFSVCLELGDLMWYMAVLADKVGVTLEEVARLNVAKLQKRYPNGFVRDWQNAK